MVIINECKIIADKAFSLYFTNERILKGGRIIRMARLK